MMSQPDLFSNTQQAGDVLFPSLTKSLGTIFLSHHHRNLKLEEKDLWGISCLHIFSFQKKPYKIIFLILYLHDYLQFLVS